MRGQGVGSLLLDYAIRFAKDHDCKRVTLLTDADNERAQQFYTKQGFTHSSMQVYRKHLNITHWVGLRESVSGEAVSI